MHGVHGSSKFICSFGGADTSLLRYVDITQVVSDDERTQIERRNLEEAIE